MTDFRGQELCERSGGRPGLPVPNSPYGLRGREATLNWNFSDRNTVSWPKWLGDTTLPVSEGEFTSVTAAVKTIGDKWTVASLR